MLCSIFISPAKAFSKPDPLDPDYLLEMVGLESLFSIWMDLPGLPSFKLDTPRQINHSEPNMTHVFYTSWK